MARRVAVFAQRKQKGNTKGDKQAPGSHRELVKMFKGHEDGILSIAMFPDGKRIATGSFDKTIRIWRLEDGTEIMKWEAEENIRALVILKNGKYVVTAEGEFPKTGDIHEMEKSKLWVRDAKSGRVIAGPLDGHTNIVRALDISPDGEILASGSWDHTVVLWDTSTWQRKGDSPISCGTHKIYCIRFSPSGQLGVATTNDIQIWDVERRECLAHFKGHTEFNDSWNTSLAWTSDGAYLFSAGSSDDPVIRPWDTSSWKQAGDSWIPNEAHILSAGSSGDPDIRYWDASSGKQAGDPVTGRDEDKHIYYIALNPTGTLLASASADCTARLWQLHTGTEIAQYKHSDRVYYVAFSVDGRFLFTGDIDGMLSRWEIREEVLTAAGADPLAGKLKNKARHSRGKQKDINRFFDSEITGQRRHLQATSSAMLHVDRQFTSSSPFHDVKSFFNRIRPLSVKKGKQREHRLEQQAPVVDVPLGQVTYGDAVGVDDGFRPYVLFFCLSWFQKKEKKPDPPPPVYDVDLMNDEQEEEILNVPAPTTRVQFAQQETSMAREPQPEAGPSRAVATEEPSTTQS